MEKLTFQEEHDLDALLASYKGGYKPFPSDCKGIGDYRCISVHGGLALCEELVDRDDGDMNEYWRRSTAIVPLDAIRQQALVALREGQATRTYQSVNTVLSKDRRSESPGSPDEREAYGTLGEVKVTMIATTMPPTLDIDVHDTPAPAKAAAPVTPATNCAQTAQDARAMDYIAKHGYEING